MTAAQIFVAIAVAGILTWLAGIITIASTPNGHGLSRPIAGGIIAVIGAVLTVGAALALSILGAATAFST